MAVDRPWESLGLSRREAAAGCSPQQEGKQGAGQGFGFFFFFLHFFNFFFLSTEGLNENQL